MSIHRNSCWLISNPSGSLVSGGSVRSRGVGGRSPSPSSQVLRLRLGGCPWDWAPLGTPPQLLPQQDLAILHVTEGLLICLLAKTVVSIARSDSSLLIVSNTCFLAVASSWLWHQQTPRRPSGDSRGCALSAALYCRASLHLFCLLLSSVLHSDAKLLVLFNFYEYLLLFYKRK